ncbi:unnamed protein product [Agarophyton chilense]
MRLTADVVRAAPQALNCVGDRELVLRNLALATLENLAAARDAFDSIDVSCNALTQLSGAELPRLSRLTTLHAGNNHIVAIGTNLSHALPNLHTLVLTTNRVRTLAQLNLPELSRLSRLRVLCVARNPVASDANFRAMVLRALPALRVLNFTRVTRAERAAGEVARAAAAADATRRRRRGRDMGDEGDTEGGGLKKRARRALSVEQMAAVRAQIEAATSVEQVVRIQKAVMAGGDVARALQTATSADGITSAHATTSTR